MAVLSRVGGEVVHRGLPGEEAFGARCLFALVGEVVFASLYCPNGKRLDHEDYPRKLRWFDSLHAFVDREFQPEDSLVLGGDFNLCPQAIDSWNEPGLRGEIFHTDAERERFARFQNWGLRDVFRARHPELQAFSWWDYRGGAFHKKQGLRIDLLLATAPVAERVAHVEIDREYRKKKEGLTASDHAPVWMDLDPGPSAD